MHYGELETFAVALLTIINPIGSAVIYVGMTQGLSADEKATIVRTSSAAVAIILLLATWIGESLLAFFSISIPVFEVAGGLIVLRLGFSMLQSGPEEGRRSPGALATVIIQTHKLPGLANNFILSVICIAMACLVWVCLRAAEPICRALGSDGVIVLTRIMGILLASVAVGMIATGTHALFPRLSAEG